MTLLTFSRSDISRSLATSAHRGTSFTPEKRADQVIDGYIEDMTSLVEQFSKYRTDENEAELAAALEQYRQGYIARYNSVLQAKSRCLSSMITGPSNFPTRRNQKALETEHKRVKDFLEWENKAINRLVLTFDPVAISRAPVSSDDDDAVAKLQEKLGKAEKLQGIMKSANAIVRKKKLSDAEKIKALSEIDGISEAAANELLKPDFAGRTGFPAYQLQNNNANIRRMKQRIETLKAEAERQPKDDREIGEVTIIENADANRIQLVFPSKPAKEVRETLKLSGFRWSGRYKAWQRMLNANGRYATEQLIPFLKELKF